ncbi:lysylphosphatidylglycerol synthase domain-containing protein [Haliangium sp.]|uniref:lysylphosphatidylglycerol synthase domain-containing protein n=1 Tax=Haliangium sp. TaxID=2663208 RepID=UPI003D136FE0
MSESAPPRLRARIRAWAPWVVAAAVLAFVGTSVSLDALLNALARVPAIPFGVLIIVLTTATLMVDTLAIWLALAAVTPTTAPRWRELLLVRAASALLSLLSYGAGQGGIVYFLYRRHGVPVEAGAGAVLVTSAASVLVVALAAGVGLLLGAIPDHPELSTVAWAALAILPTYLLVLVLRPRFLLRRRLLRHVFGVGVGALLRVLAARACHLGVLITGHWLAMRLFDIHVPVAVALLQLPAVFLVGALPISPSGLGTTQAAAVALFAPYATGVDADHRQATVLAYSLACHITGVAVLLLLGFLSWRHIERRSLPPTTSVRETA